MFSFTELEKNLLTSFNVYRFLHDAESKEAAAISVGMLASLSEGKLQHYAAIASAVMRGTLIDHLTTLLMDSEPHSDDFRRYERMVINYRTGVITDKMMLESVYENLMAMTVLFTGGDENIVLRAMESIERKTDLILKA